MNLNQYKPRHPPWELVVLPTAFMTLAGAVSGGLAMPFFWHVPWQVGLGLGLGIGAFFGSMIWSSILTQPYMSYSRAMDATAANLTARKTPQQVTVHMDIRNNSTGYPKVDWPQLDLPPSVTYAHLLAVAKIVIAKNYLIKGSDFYPESVGRPMSRPQWEALRDAFVRHDILAWVNPHDPHPGVYVRVPLGRNFFQRLNEMGNENALPADRVLVLKVLKKGQ